MVAVGSIVYGAPPEPAESTCWSNVGHGSYGAVRVRTHRHPAQQRRGRWTEQLPDLIALDLAPPDGDAPTFFGAYYEWMMTPPPSWADVAWMRENWQQLSG